MNTIRIVEQVKEAIMKELLVDVDNKNCALDLYIENRDSKQLSKVSQEFLENRKSELTKEYKKGKNLFFRKYNYEKILIQYLETQYGVDNIEFDLFPSDKKKRELEERRRQELKEKQCIELERSIIKQIPYMKWEKMVKISSDVYSSTFKDGKQIKLYYIHGKLGKCDKIPKESIIFRAVKRADLFKK